MSSRSNLVEKILLLVLAISTLSINSVVAADVPDEQFSVNTMVRPTSSVGSFGVYFEESVDTLRMPSLLYGYNQKSNGWDAVAFCNSLSDSACSSAAFFRYYALFPPCANQTSVDCIENVYAITPGSPARINGVYKETMPSVVANKYAGSVEAGLPEGGNAGVWEIPNVLHKGGTSNYAVIMSNVGVISRDGSNFTNTTNGNNLTGDFRAAIFPVNVIQDARYKANVAMISLQNNGNMSVGISHPSQLPFDVCAIVDNGQCAIREGFPEDVQFGLTVRFSRVVTGWMHGRIQNPEIDYQVTSYGSRVDMKGLSTKVPIVAGWVNRNEVTDPEKSTYIPSNLPDGNAIYPGASGDHAIKSLSFWNRLLGDKAVANPSEWIFYNLPRQDMQGASSCITSSKTLAGFVTTNSTTYSAGPPVFNQEAQSLDYKVASAHFLKDGSVFKGEYDLYIDSKVARCIYKFSNAPISATVSIIDENGKASVATTTLHESAGWLHLAAKGFTFSNPTLRVTLKQEAEKPKVEATPIVTPSATPSSETQTKKSRITCIKGKSRLNRTGINPQCPKGYRKVA